MFSNGNCYRQQTAAATARELPDKTPQWASTTDKPSQFWGSRQLVLQQRFQWRPPDCRVWLSLPLLPTVSAPWVQWHRARSSQIWWSSRCRQMNSKHTRQINCLTANNSIRMNDGRRSHTVNPWAPARGGQGGQPPTLEKIRVGYAHPGHINRGLKTFRQ